MPDYSGYAPRQQQQDPNLAAWAQIGGNIANIFGLDPAKAAEARRGIQQEDYNELRNQAQIRQQLANKRVGELLGGKGFDTARGEFVDPVAYQQFVQAMSDLGDARQAIPFGPGRWNAQQQAKIDTENRSTDYKAGVQAKRDEKEAAKQAEALKDAAAKVAAAKSKEAGNKWDRMGKTGHSKVGVSPKAAVDELWALLTEGREGTPKYDQSQGFTAVTPETKELPDNQKRRVFTAGFQSWLSNSGYGNHLYPQPIRQKMREEFTDFEDEKKSIFAILVNKFTDPSTGQKLISDDQMMDLTERIIARELTTSYEQNKDKADKVARISDAKSMKEFLQNQMQLPPEKRSESVLYRVKVPGPRNEYTYEDYNLAWLLDPENVRNKDHPLFNK
jgi:hypothetical protein